MLIIIFIFVGERGGGGGGKFTLVLCVVFTCEGQICNNVLINSKRTLKVNTVLEFRVVMALMLVF